MEGIALLTAIAVALLLVGSGAYGIDAALGILGH